MKKILIFFSLLVSVQVIAQTYPITSITISLPTNPDANTANWGSGTSLFTITANSKAVNGRVDGHVSESKILVTIKKGGAKVCGSFAANTAPSSNFNMLTKVWSGTNAVSLLGQSCVLPAGEYELTVQFFGAGAAGLAPLSEEKIKPFSIIAKEQLSYQPPQAIAPANGTALSEIDIKKPITFRWTPVIPRPQEPVTYRLKVWQLMQGQNGAQAMATNQPIITKDVDNLTQTMLTNLISGPCLAPYLCDYIWNVQALNREGKPVGGNNGMSEALKFNVQAVNDAPSKIALVFPANGSTISANDKPKFTWKHEKQNTESSNTYKIKIVEIIGDQSPEEALRTNKPHFEKDSLKEISFQYPLSAPSFIAGKKYGWNVQALNREGKPVGGNNGNSIPNTFSVNNNKLKTTPATDTGDSLITVKSNPPPAVSDTGSAAIGDTIRAGFDGEFLIAVTQVTKESDGSITGKGTVTVNWLSTNIAVEFSKIRIDTSKRLTAGGIITEKSAGANYIQAWLIANLTAEAATIPLDKPLNWTNNTVDNLVGWYNNNNFGLPDFKYQSNVTAPPIPANSLKMPYGIKFTDTTDKLMITEIVFKPNVSKINFLAQKKFTRGVTDYNLGFAGKYFEIHPNQINFSNGRVELVEDIDVPNLVSDPKMKFTFKKGAPAAGCYIEWDSTGVKDVGLGLDVKFSRDWLLPVPTASDSVKATITGNGTSLQNILLTGSLSNCEIVGTNGIKMLADSITLDLSDTRNPASMYFPANYTSDTTAQGKLLWQGFYIKTLGLTLPDTWKTGANPTQITASNTIIDDYGVTMKLKAINIITFPTGRVSDMSASLDTLNLSILKGSLTDGNAKGKLVLPISRDTITNTLKYTATFAQTGGANNFQIVIVPTGPIDADILKGKMTLSPTSNITASLSDSLKTMSIKLNGKFNWGDKDLAVTDTATATGAAPIRKKGIKGMKMEMDFENIKLDYTNNSTANTNTLSFNPGSWSFASPQKRLANFPVTIKNVYYKSLTTVAAGNNVKELVRGALLIDIVANLTDDIGGSTTVGGAFAVEMDMSAKKFKPKFKGVFIEDISVYADMPAVKIDGKLKMYDNDPTYGDGFMANLGVTFTAVSIQANALVQFGNTTWNNNNQYYRYWRAEADAKFEPGIPFLTGVGFYGFGGGAFYNMKANLVTRAAPQVGFKYVFEPKKSSLGFKVMATIATLPKFETFNSDVELLAQFNGNTGGLTKIGFTGNFWLAAKLEEREPNAKIKGGVVVEYNFPDKIFYMAALLSVNVPPAITTPSPVGFVMNINGLTNKWYFKAGTPTSTNKVKIFGIDLYSYLMFGNDIPTPNGFTPRFTNNYYAAVGSSPTNGNVTGGVGTNTSTGKGIAAGIGIEFSRNISKHLYEGACRNWSIGGNVLAGAELNLALMHQTGCIGINGYRASGNIGLYGSVAATITGTSFKDACNDKSINLFSIKTGAWLMGKFPNPEYVAGALTADISLFNGLCEVSYNQSFEKGTNCNGTEVVTADAAQEDEADSLRNKLIQYVAPNMMYNFPVASPINVKYALVPDRIFDVAENQGDGTIKNRTFKLVITKSLEVKNSNGDWVLLALQTKANTIGEYQYYIKAPLSTTVAQANNQLAPSIANQLNSNNGNTLISANGVFHSAAIISPLPPPPPPNYPNPAPSPVNNLVADRDYRFVVTASLKELTGSTWNTSVTRTGAAVTETKTKLFRTGPIPMIQANSSAPRAR